MSELSVVLPAYNEAGSIAHAITSIRSHLRSRETQPAGPEAIASPALEIVVADDCSSDATAAVAQEAGADLVIALPDHRGKGAAVRAGMLAAHGRIRVFTDTDLAYGPEGVAVVSRAVAAGAAMAVGSRRHPDSTTVVGPSALRAVGGRLMNRLVGSIVLGRTRDTQCGLKAFRDTWARELFAASRIDGFAFDVELFALADRAEIAVVEVPVTLASSSESSVHVGAEAARMVRDLLRIRRRFRGRGGGPTS